MSQPQPEEAVIAAEIARMRTLSIAALRQRWQVEFGRKPPAGLSKDMLGRMIAWRIQERAFGGLDRDSLAFLDRLAGQVRAPRRQFKPGTVFVREYRGQRQTVTVSREGFDWNGAAYRSLSAIARAITGTAWNGRRFFGVVDAHQQGASTAQISAADRGRGSPSTSQNRTAAARVVSPGRKRTRDAVVSGRKMVERSA
jgi:hypothetical protein